VLSEFIDAWSAGQRPNVDEYVVRVPAEEQDALGEELATFLTFAPTPAYSDAALTAIRAEIGETRNEANLIGALLAHLRSRLRVSTGDVAAELMDDLGLDKQQVPKASGYLERLESGSLDPTRVSRRVFEALGRLFGLAGDAVQLTGPPIHSLTTAAHALGLPVAEVGRAWAALGLTVAGPDEFVLSQADVDGLATWADMRGPLGDEAATALLRVVGSGMARLSEAVASMIRANTPDIQIEQSHDEFRTARAYRVAAEFVPRLGALMDAVQAATERSRQLGK